MLLLIPSEHVQELLEQGRGGGGGEWKGEGGSMHGKRECENVKVMEEIKVHSHIRGSPDVTGTRKRNGIREEGNERDVVSQTFLRGGGRHTAQQCTAEFISYSQ